MNLLVDGFTFFDELELLKFRLKELDSVVDHFVLVESNLTFSGLEKPLYFQDNKDRFAEYGERIVHVVFEQSADEHDDPWAREAAQRNAIRDGVERIGIAPEDYIMISDYDEIPNPDLLSEIRLHGFNIFSNPDNQKYFFNLSEIALEDYRFDDQIFGFLQDFYFYNLECRHVSSIWWQSRILTYRKLLELEQPDKIRRMDINHQYYSKAGWHFSYFGGANRIMNKIRSFSHQEFNNPRYVDPDRIERAIKNKMGLFGEDSATLEHVPIESNVNLPRHYRMLLQPGGLYGESSRLPT